MRRFIDLAGERFGRLVASKRDQSSKRWICICDCGNIVSVRADHLKDGHVLSCGCLSSESSKNRFTTHGMSRTRINRIWRGMKQRCFNPNATGYENYGGRGISVCSEWKNSFESFCDWAFKNGYSDSLSIDRIDGGGSYCPDNCRWETSFEQSRNTRANRVIDVDGNKMVLKDFCNMVGAPYHMVLKRLLRGWELYDAISIPPLTKGGVTL